MKLLYDLAKAEAVLPGVHYVPPGHALARKLLGVVFTF